MAKQLVGAFFGHEIYIDADLPFGWWYFDYPRVKARALRLEAVADAALVLHEAVVKHKPFDVTRAAVIALGSALDALAELEVTGAGNSTEQKHS